jgi:hypothetical protein
VTARWGLALVAAVAGCGGVTGTVSLELVTAPGSDVLDDVVVARLTLSSPPTVIEAQRGTDGRFRLELDVPADGPAGRLTFEGFAAGGERIAIGRSAALPIAAYDAEIAIYVARPDTLAAAPVALEPARDQLGVATYGFGVLVVGGRAADGAAVDDVQIYKRLHPRLAGRRAAAGAAGPTDRRRQRQRLRLRAGRRWPRRRGHRHLVALRHHRGAGRRGPAPGRAAGAGARGRADRDRAQRGLRGRRHPAGGDRRLHPEPDRGRRAAEPGRRRRHRGGADR